MAAETLSEAMVGQAQSLQMKELSNYNVFATKLPFQGEQIEYLLIAKNFFYHGVDSTLRKNQAVHVPFASTILAASASMAALKATGTRRRSSGSVASTASRSHRPS